MKENMESGFSSLNSDSSKEIENQMQNQDVAKTPRSLLFSVKPLNEVTGRHQRGFDGEGSEGT